MEITKQLIWLFVLPIPIACIAWTVTHEEVFREPREFCSGRCKSGKTVIERKFFYLFTCEYCFSHYITLIFLCLTKYKLLMDNWMGYVIAGFALVWISNIYMSIFAYVKQDIKREKAEITMMDELSDL